MCCALCIRSCKFYSLEIEKLLLGRFDLVVFDEAIDVLIGRKPRDVVIVGDLYH